MTTILLTILISGTIVDTGVPQGSGSSGLAYFDPTKKANNFWLLDNANVTGVQMYLQTYSEGVSWEDEEAPLDLVIHEGFGTIGDELYRTQFYAPDQSRGEWMGPAAGLDWELEPGSYWLVVEIPEGSVFNGGVPINPPVPPPLASHYWTKWWHIEHPDNRSSYGARIFGEIGPKATGDINRDFLLDITDLRHSTDRILSQQYSDLYDFNSDGELGASDLRTWVELADFTLGDANADGFFDSSDLVQVFVAGKYDTGEVATWEEGDWNFDFQTDSKDLVDAMKAGAYEQQAVPAVAVPEPAAVVLFLLALVLTATKRK